MKNQTIEHWQRQNQIALKPVDQRVFQVSQIRADRPYDRPLVVASGSKQSIQRLLSRLALEDGPYRYAITACFQQPPLPGLEIER